MKNKTVNLPDSVDRRYVAKVWTACVISSVALPVHAQTSDPIQSVPEPLDPPLDCNSDNFGCSDHDDDVETPMICIDPPAECLQ